MRSALLSERGAVFARDPAATIWFLVSGWFPGGPLFPVLNVARRSRLRLRYLKEDSTSLEGRLFERGVSRPPELITDSRATVDDG